MTLLFDDLWTLLDLVDLIESRAHFQPEVYNDDTPGSWFLHCCRLSFKNISTFICADKIEATYMSTYYPMIKHKNHV